MTRDEALDVLKRNYPSRCFEDLCKAVDIAIKALSAQPEIIRCKDCKYMTEHYDTDGILERITMDFAIMQKGAKNERTD